MIFLILLVAFVIYLYIGYRWVSKEYVKLLVDYNQDNPLSQEQMMKEYVEAIAFWPILLPRIIKGKRLLQAMKNKTLRKQPPTKKKSF